MLNYLSSVFKVASGHIGFSNLASCILEKIHVTVFFLINFFLTFQEKTIALKIFELGLKRFADIPEYALCYIDFMSHLNGKLSMKVSFIYCFIFLKHISNMNKVSYNFKHTTSITKWNQIHLFMAIKIIFHFVHIFCSLCIYLFCHHHQHYCHHKNWGVKNKILGLGRLENFKGLEAIVTQIF